MKILFLTFERYISALRQAIIRFILKQSNLAVSGLQKIHVNYIKREKHCGMKWRSFLITLQLFRSLSPPPLLSSSWKPEPSLQAWKACRRECVLNLPPAEVKRRGRSGPAHPDWKCTQAPQEGNAKEASQPLWHPLPMVLVHIARVQ